MKGTYIDVDKEYWAFVSLEHLDLVRHGSDSKLCTPDYIDDLRRKADCEARSMKSEICSFDRLAWRCLDIDCASHPPVDS
jgi:hypothetical protein